MALNTSKCNHLMPLRFKGLTSTAQLTCRQVRPPTLIEVVRVTRATRPPLGRFTHLCRQRRRLQRRLIYLRLVPRLAVVVSVDRTSASEVAIHDTLRRPHFTRTCDVVIIDLAMITLQQWQPFTPSQTPVARCLRDCFLIDRQIASERAARITLYCHRSHRNVRRCHVITAFIIAPVIIVKRHLCVCVMVCVCARIIIIIILYYYN